MTIGKKIKYVRSLYHMSSAELAERSGIHPVSIRKYETDKMIPGAPQIERIAAAFMLSPAVFNGLTDINFDFNFSGDCLAALILLTTSGFLQVDGERRESGALEPETIRFTLSPLLDRFLKLSSKTKALSITDFTISLKQENALKQFAFWEFMYRRRDELYEQYLEEDSEESKEAYEQICNDYDETEMNAILHDRLGSIFMQSALD